MSSAPPEQAPQASAPPKSATLRKVLIGLLAVPLLGFILPAANALRLEQQTEQARRKIGAAGGKSTTERRVPGWVAVFLGDDAHSFLDQTVIVGVTMTGDEIGNDQVAQISDVPDLSWLDLHDSKVTSAGLPAIAKLTSVRSIDMTNSQVSDVAALATLPHLEELKIDFSQPVLPEHLEALSEFPALRALGAGGLKLRDNGVEIIARNCPQLEQLSIIGATLGDNGLVPLQQLKNLKELSLAYAKYNGDDLAAFRKAVPDCQILN